MDRICSWAMLLMGVAFCTKGTLGQNPAFANEGLPALFNYNPQQLRAKNALEFQQWNRDQVLFPFAVPASLLDKRKAPASFYGMRGKKTPAGFIGMRGKKAYPSDEFLRAFPSGLALVRDLVEQRGKQLQSGTFMGSRGKKAPQQAFFGMRGKKGGNSMGFLGVRGKKEQYDPLLQVDQLPLALHPNWSENSNISVGMKGTALTMDSSSDTENTELLCEE